MRYAYNEVGGLVNGVNFFFEKGDDEIVGETFRGMADSRQLPTSILWNGLHMTPREVLQKLHEKDALSEGYLGVRFIVWNKFSKTPNVDEGQPLRAYLAFIRKKYPALLSLADGIERDVFSIAN